MPLRYYVKIALKWFEKEMGSFLESSSEHSEEVAVKAWEESLKRFGMWVLELNDVEALSLTAALKAYGDDVSNEVYSMILTPIEEMEIPYDDQDFRRLKKAFEELSSKLDGKLRFHAEKMAQLIDTAIKLNSPIIVRPINDSLT